MSAPGQSGVKGTLLRPVAITTRSALSGPFGRRHHPAVALPVDALDLDSDADVELVEGRIERQVLGNAVACRPLAEPARDRVARQAREPAHRVQVQPVVAARPDRADLGALEHDDLLACARQLGGRRQPGRTSADHRDHTVVLHDGAPAANAGSADLHDQRRLPPVRVERRDPQRVRALRAELGGGNAEPERESTRLELERLQRLRGLALQPPADPRALLREQELLAVRGGER